MRVGHVDSTRANTCDLKRRALSKLVIVESLLLFENDLTEWAGWSDAQRRKRSLEFITDQLTLITFKVT